MLDDVLARPMKVARRSGCEEHNNLLDAFGVAVRELLRLHEQQILAIVEGDTEFNRYDLLIHMANEEKQLAKYRYLRHVESHGCSNIHALDETRTRSDYRQYAEGPVYSSVPKSA